MLRGGYKLENEVRIRDGVVIDQTGRRQLRQDFESQVEDPGRGRNLEHQQSLLNKRKDMECTRVSNW